MVHAIYAFVQSKRSGTTAEEQTNDGRKTEEVAPSVLQVVCPDSVRGWELLLVVGVEHRGGFKIVVLAVFHLEIFCKRGLASIYTLFLPYLQTLQAPSTESENTTLQRYRIFSDFHKINVNFYWKMGGGNTLIVNLLQILIHT